MLQEFKEFISRGNVIQLAVGIIIGASFTAIVSSLVDDLINPLLGLVVGGIDFSAISFGLGDAQFMIGNFINALIKFLIIAWVVFLLVKIVNKALNMGKKPEAPVEEPPAGPTSEELLTEIRDLLKTR
jgi:large conductance mechanosensitive channel